MQINDPRRKLAERLAQQLKDSSTLPLLQFLSNGAEFSAPRAGAGPFASLAEDARGLMATPDDGRARVGIWAEDAESGEFVRSAEHRDLWRFCADVERIPVKGTRRRLVFLGESVGRGFFFDPFHCPATVLERQLSSAAEHVEVVDLAQSNCDPWWLLNIAGSVRHLKPDGIVVFAGNNWSLGPLANQSAERFAVDGALLEERHGFAELLQRQREQLNDFAVHVVVQLALAAEGAGVPLILVVPELNIADWRTGSEHSMDVPVLSGPDTQAWIENYRSASDALERGDSTTAERLTRALVDIDAGTCATSLGLLAKVLRERGDEAGATAALRRGRDLSVGFLDGTRVVPGVFPGVAEVMRRVGSEAGATVVDLHRVFAELSDGRAPGRRWFLDYCHLTAEGIRVAMSAVARAIGDAVLGRELELRELMLAAPAPSAEHEAWAHVLAGIHNAHWGQPGEICTYHFSRALDISPALERHAFDQIFDAFRHTTPSMLSSSFGEVVKNEAAAVYLLGYGLHSKEFGLVQEHVLLRSMAAASPRLAAMSLDPDAELGEAKVLDLLQPHWSALTDPNRSHRRAYTVAYGVESSFSFVCGRTARVSLQLTYRVPGACSAVRADASGAPEASRDRKERAKELIVECNGVAICRCDAAGEWSSTSVTIPADSLRAGYNELTLSWPNLARDDARLRLRREFEAGRPLDVRTHFGELYELLLVAETE